MTTLRALYPQRVADADHWRAMLAGYHVVLGERDEALLVEAFNSAWREFPSFFPSAGELADLVTRVARRRQSVNNGKQIPEVSSAAGEIPAAVRDILRQQGLL
jgi:hypothetical protein